MNDTRPAWDEYGILLARTVALRADCTRRKVGAVIVDPEHRLVSTGYNGAPAGEPGCASAGACPRGRSDVATRTSYDAGAGFCIAVHAEVNAIIYARRDLRDCTLYVTCAPCAATIRAAGLLRVVWPEDSD